jgi:hypothetical protein
MIRMLRTADILLSIRLSSAANRIIYYARRLPLVGRAVPEWLYGDRDLKKAFTVLAWIAIIAGHLLGKAIYLGLFAALPALAWPAAEAGEDRLRLFVHIFLWLSFVSAGVAMATALEPKREKWVAVKLMRMAPGAYMRTHFAFKYTLYFLTYVPNLMLFVGVMGGPPPMGVLLAAAATGWRLVCEYAHLQLFARTGKIVIRDNVLVWTVIGISCAAAYLPLTGAGWAPVVGVLLKWPAAGFLAAAGAAAAFGLARYPRYREAVDAAARRDDPMLDFGRMMAEAREAGMRSDVRPHGIPLDAAAVSPGEPEAGGGTGYAFLNRLFFARHRKFLARPVWRRVALSAGLAAAGLAAFGLSGDRLRALAVWETDVLAPYVPVFMSLYAIGEAVCRAMFYHCDRPLMRYGFYRRAAAVHFRIRLVRLAGCNLAAGAALALAAAAVQAASGRVPARDMLLLAGLVLMLSVLFSVHHLAMYYLLQPYTTELNVRNPFFVLASAAVTGLCWACVFIRPSAAALAAASAVAAAAYGIAALFLVHRLGIRTFRVK